MKMSSSSYMQMYVLAIVAFLAVMTFSGPANAGEYTVGTNLSSMSELTAKFSKMLSSGKVDAKTQEKMGEILSQMSQVLSEMAGPTGATMTGDHNQKIKNMKKDFDPFDTSGRM
ncbi:MAG: hypothetical protein R3274_07735 [Desulfobacterales bacterium]|nr:hypothetical protein [Desulfobacterales bacterium]